MLKRKTRIIVTTITGLVFGVMIIVQEIDNARTRRTVAEAADWPTTTGELLDARTERIVTKRRLEERTFVKYVFSVDGKQYKGDTIALAPFPKKPDYVAMQKAGTPVAVHYNPKNPSECTLEFGEPFGWTDTIMGIPLWFILTGGVWLVLANVWFVRKKGDEEEYAQRHWY